MHEPSAPAKYFTLTHDQTAAIENKRPLYKGVREGGDQEPGMVLTLWAETANILRGTWEPRSVSDTTLAATVQQPTPMPKVDNLEVGRAILWKDPEATAENRRPEFTGYVRQGENSFLTVALWRDARGTRAKVEPYRSGPGAAAPQAAPPPGGAT